LNQRTALYAWVASVFLIAIAAGSSFAVVTLSKEAGAQVIELTGYLVFPIANALILLQTAAMLVSFFTPVKLTRILSALLVPVMTWHLVLVVASTELAISRALLVAVADVTGVSGLEAQLGLIESSVESGVVLWYLLALVLNITVLLGKAVLNLPSPKPKERKPDKPDASDLWDSQS